MKLKRSTPIICLLGMAALMGGPLLTLSQAATSSGSEDIPDIPIPKTQLKIELDGVRAFGDGELAVGILEIGATSAQITANDEGPFTLRTGQLTLVAVDDETICTLTYLGKSGKKAIVAARCDGTSGELQAALDAQNEAAEHAGETVAPLDLAADTEKGKLENPYGSDTGVIAEGRALYLANSCNGCHGGGGGGGMGPPLTNPVWVYGDDDDTLFRLVVLGSEELLADGYSRVAREKVVGPMPPFGEIIEDSDQLWKILAFIRSINKG